MATETIAEQLANQRRKVDFDTYDIIVGQLISMVESGAIDVAPAYQRQFRWNDQKRAQLIESVFLGVPIPSLFMATNKDGTWELVDGVQRLSTLVQYGGTKDARKKLNLKEPLKIDGLGKLSALNGTKFSDLPDSLRLHFNHRPIKVITLSDKSDLIVRFDLFERLNTGGVALTNQEIRACIYRGAFADFLEKLAADPNFLKAVRLTETQRKDGTKEECVLRFFAFLNRYKKFEHSVVDFLNEYMASATKSFDYDAGEKIFRETFKQLHSALPNGIVRGSTRNLTPINLYEGIAVGAALAIKARGKIATRKEASWIASDELKKATTGATNSLASVTKRIEYCRDRFLGV